MTTTILPRAGATASNAEDAAYARVTWRLLPLLFICYVAAYLDRVNVGFAKLQMLNDLHFSEAIYGTAFAALGKKLEPITQDAAVFFEDHAVIGDEAGQVAVEVQAGNKVANAFKGVKAAIHQNHGLLTASRHSIDAAAFWFIALERCCQQQLLVDASGVTPRLVTPERARYSREHVGSEFIGWLHFQALYEQIALTQPDMFN